MYMPDRKIKIRAKAEKIFATAKSYTDKLDFFQKKMNYTYENVDDSPIQSYEYIARVQ